MELSKDQLKAIHHGAGPALVLAVPGSGKTTVLLHRLEYLKSQGINPQRVASLTFSKTQAVDMRRKYIRQFGSAEGLTFSTIHSFAYAIIRAYARKHRVQISLIEDSPVSKYQLLHRFFFQVNHKRMSEEQMEDFFRIHSYLKNALSTYEDYRKMTGVRFPKYEEIAKLYEDYKSQNGLIDFDDMILLAYDFLDRDPDLLGELQERFPYFQIDEGQDTSFVQMRLIQKIAHPKNNLFLVADDDQAIYGFRGADPRSLLDFKERYPNARMYFLPNNYRCPRHIVTLSGKFIRKNQDRYSKKVETENESEEKIQILHAKNLRSELQYVMKELEKYEDKEVAVLYRNHLSSVVLTDLLGQKGVDFFMKDSKLFFRHFIIRDLLDIYHFAMDPTDFRTFERIYFKLDCYFKKSFVQEVGMMDPLLPVTERLYQVSGINSYYEDKIAELEYHIRNIQGMSFEKALPYIYWRLGYEQFVIERARRNQQPLHTTDRYAETLFELAKGVQTEKEMEEKLRWLQGIQDQAQRSEGNLTLSTIHGAKGLEFDIVFLLDLVQDEFPSATALEREAEGDLSVLEEERRLFYVAMTRAKEKLYLFSLKTRNDRAVEPSQFLKELTK